MESLAIMCYLISPREVWLKFWISNIPCNISDWWPGYHLWNCPQMNVTGPHWLSVNIGAGNGFVPLSSGPLPDTILTAIFRQFASLGRNKLINNMKFVFVIWKHCLLKSFSLNCILENFFAATTLDRHSPRCVPRTIRSESTWDTVLWTSGDTAITWSAGFVGNTKPRREQYHRLHF